MNKMNLPAPFRPALPTPPLPPPPPRLRSCLTPKAYPDRELSSDESEIESSEEVEIFRAILILIYPSFSFFTHTPLSFPYFPKFP